LETPPTLIKKKRPKSRPTYLRDQAYNAPIGALSFNFNSAAVYVKPGKKGEAVIAYTDPPDNNYVDIVNQAKTTRAGRKNTLSVTRIEPPKKDRIAFSNPGFDLAKAAVGDTVLLRGQVPLNASEQRFYRNIVNPTLYTSHIFKMYLEKAGVVIQGNVLEGKTPASVKKLVEFESLPLWQIVWGMNKFSNNFTADQLLKSVGAEQWGEPGTLQKGLTSLADSLEDIGIKRKSYKILDGSGLTRKSRISANQILKVLRSAYHDLSISGEFMASLPIAGQDGTLRRRLTRSSLGTLRAKTGSLNGVASLAGYTQTRDKEKVAFVILLNDPQRKYGRMTGWVDKIAQEIAKYSRRAN